MAHRFGADLHISRLLNIRRRALGQAFRGLGLALARLTTHGGRRCRS
ncbi:hypothetical protein BZL29_2164 [Mycobacterium kansasii]|uniref:Uncharacterized protein n=1 Tax=Mycobacterium kansasii TaxID=1768 RepID=A0A1V3XLJ2_MYCKA|nr:hypothetical protein BZL29_2164 [Mycobacterium kansasii]